MTRTLLRASARRRGGWVGWALVLAGGAAAAQQPPVMTVKRSSESSQGGPGQQALTVEASGGELRAASCARAPCPAAQGQRIDVPEAFRAALGDAQLSTLTLGNRRTVVQVVVTRQGRSWVALVAGPLQPGPARVLFSGEADVTGAPTATESKIVQVVREGGVAQLVVGSRSADIDLCGRPAPLSPRVLDPSDMELKPARMQRLAKAERDGARRLVAERQAAPRPAPLGRLLHAVGASSGLGGPGALTDGDLDTSWSEARGGDGRGEFVVMRTPKDVPLASVSVVVRPRSHEPPRGAAPKRFYLVDDAGVHEVTLPEDAWKNPGVSYQVTFSEPLVTSCLALVLDEAYVPDGEPSPAVTLAEVEARSVLDGKVDLAGLVQQLGAGGRGARAAAALLARGGPEARKLIEKSYDDLDETGRLLALSAVDQGSCEDASPLYVRALASKQREELRHARARIERCRRGSVPALVAAVADPAHPARAAAATELALLSPPDALDALARAPDDGKDPRAFRQALGKAASSPRSSQALARWLADASLPPRRTLALMRAAGPALAAADVSPVAVQALGRVAPAGAAFEERYLALAPAAVLAASDQPTALDLLRSALADPFLPLRSGAAAAAGAVVPLRPALLALARDPEPRVREAIARALQGQTGADERRALLSLLPDEWTFVRSAAYDALAAAGADPAVDDALLGRLGSDPSPLSSARLIEVLGKRGVGKAGDALRKLLDDRERPLDLRVRAARALGAVCHRASIDRLTELARAGAEPMAGGDAQMLSGAALVALGRLHPPDLAARLSPLLGEGASRVVAMAARAALDETERCGG